MLAAYLFAQICFRLDFAIYSSFYLQIFPQGGDVFCFFLFLALAIPCSQWSNIVCLSFLVIKGFYEPYELQISVHVAWAENHITSYISPNVWRNIPGLICPSSFFFLDLFDASLQCLQWSQTDSSWRILLIKIKAWKICSRGFYSLIN